MKKVLICLLVLLLLVGCSKKQEDVPEGDKPLFEVIDDFQALSYSHLNMVDLVNREGEKFVLLVPCEHELSGDTFTQTGIFPGTWSIQLTEGEDIEEFINSFDSYDEIYDIKDSGVSFISGTYSRELVFKDTGLTNFYFCMETKGIQVFMSIFFNVDELDENALETLKELKDVYMLQNLSIPDEIDYEIQEIPEEELYQDVTPEDSEIEIPEE